MGTIKNVSEQAIEIRGHRVGPGETATVRGKLPPSVQVLVRLGALQITDVEETDNEDAKFSIGKVERIIEETSAPVPSPDERFMDVIRALPEDAFMADGRPEVRAINEAKEEDLPNITAADRDRIWDAMGSKV